MTRHLTTLRALFATLFAAVLFTHSAVAQSSTTFTYQGSLTSSGTPYTGFADLRAELFSTLSGGSPISPAVNLTNVSVTNGVFTVPLDFGAAFDTGQPRWIEISVRAPAGAGGYTTLSPRQALTPTPLAQGIAGVPITRGGPETLDQSQAETTGNAGNVGAFGGGNSWQSFTPTFTGYLTRLQLRGTSASVNAQPLNVRLHLGVGNSGPIIGEFNMSAPDTGYEVTLLNFAVPNFFVQAGLPYTLAFNGQVLLEQSNNQIVNASGLMRGGPYNYWFRTFVTPVPSINAAASNAAFAAIANTASTATNATNAASVPWSGLTGQAAVSTGTIGTGWQMLFNNSTTSFRGGVRLADSGFLEITNNAAVANPSFARLASNGTWSAVSDERLKTDISPAEGHLDAVMKLRPVNFRWKSTGAADLGFIAQDVRRILPTLVTGDDATERLTLNYSQLSVVAIGAIQELKSRHDAQLESFKAELKIRNAEAERREAEIADLKARLERLERLQQGGSKSTP